MTKTIGICCGRRVDPILFFSSSFLFFLLELETDWKRMLKLVCIVLRRHQINVDRRRSSPASLDVLIFFLSVSVSVLCFMFRFVTLRFSKKFQIITSNYISILLLFGKWESNQPQNNEKKCAPNGSRNK